MGILQTTIGEKRTIRCACGETAEAQCLDAEGLSIWKVALHGKTFAVEMERAKAPAFDTQAWVSSSPCQKP